MNYGTIFECDGKRAIRHRIPQGDMITLCDRMAMIPEHWNPKSRWNIETGGREEMRCWKCYPKLKKGRKSWLTGKK